MIKSMTGYGRKVYQYNSKSISIEIKLLNSKVFDLNLKIPALLREYENEIRNIVSTTFERGKIDLLVWVENNNPTQTFINEVLFEHYFHELETLSKKVNNPIPTDIFRLTINHPEVHKKESESLSDDEWATFVENLNETCQQADTFRIEEGLILKNIFLQNIEKIKTLLSQIDSFELKRFELVRDRLRKNIESILGDNQYDKSRFEQEMIYYIEKMDITEEKVRLNKHLVYFIETLETPTSNGKKLGFIAQELGREINTIGSKANYFEIQQLVVNMKDELEQIKEQLGNIL